MVTVFVNGCFWHGHNGCRYFRIPKTRPDFWSEKILQNSLRDATAIQRLLSAGWRVAVVWECALRDEPEWALDTLVQFIRSNDELVDIASPKTARSGSA